MDAVATVLRTQPRIAFDAVVLDQHVQIALGPDAEPSPLQVVVAHHRIAGEGFEKDRRVHFAQVAT
ncbi:hypothetical protein D3C77_762250 [compost metagenome]